MDAVSQVRHKVELVQKFPLFSGIPLADCASIVSAAHEKRFARRDTLFAEGDSIREILLLVSGWVKVTQFGQNGSEVILRLNGPGEMVGALGLCARGEHCSTALTVQPSTALVWDAAAFESVSERFTMLRRNTTRLLEERLRELEQRFREVSTEKVAPRLSSQLVRLSNQLSKSVNECVSIHLSREELAQLTGTSLFTVSRLLSKWELQGFVSAQREVVMVRNIPALMQLSEGR